MADMSYMPYAQRAAEIERQRKLAELLQQQYAEPIQQQTAGGFVVPISPWQTVAKLAQAGLGAYMQNKADKQAAELDTQQRKEAKEQVESYFKGLGPQKSYTSTPVMEQSSDEDRTEMAPKMQFNDITGEYEPERKWSEVSTPGMSRNQALAKLLEMKGSDNKYLADASSVLAGALPKEVDASDLFNKLDMDKLTPASRQKVLATGDISYAEFAPQTMTPYQEAELKMREAEAKVRAAEAARDNARGDAQLANSQAQLQLAIAAREQSKKEFELNFPNVGTTGAAGQPKGRTLSAGEYSKFKAADAAIDETAGNFSNFRSVLQSVSPVKGLVGEQSGQLATAYKEAQASIRKLQETGVLNQGEIPFLEQALSNPQGFMAIADPFLRSKLVGQLNELDKLVKRKRVALYKQYEQPLPAPQKPETSLGTTTNSGFTNIAPGTEQYYQGGQ